MLSECSSATVIRHHGQTASMSKVAKCRMNLTIRRLLFLMLIAVPAWTSAAVRQVEQHAAGGCHQAAADRISRLPPSACRRGPARALGMPLAEPLACPYLFCSNWWWISRRCGEDYVLTDAQNMQSARGQRGLRCVSPQRCCQLRDGRRSARRRRHAAYSRCGGIAG